MKIKDKSMKIDFTQRDFSKIALNTSYNLYTRVFVKIKFL